MTPPNPLQDGLRSGAFLHIVELETLEGADAEGTSAAAAELAALGSVVAAGIPCDSRSTTAPDPVQAALAVRAGGLTPNVHVTSVDHDRRGLGRLLDRLSREGLYNILATTGDYPSEREAVFDIDSVNLVWMIDRMRRSGVPFQVSVAVSPFKYNEPDQMYQYIKLEKKFRAGADFAITQLGFDARKLAELRRYLDEHGIDKPVIGQVHVLSTESAEEISRGRPAGCWVSPELLERIGEETRADDGGRRARLERAACTLAVLRGLGYAGAYISGTRQADDVRWIVDRGEELAPDWKRLAGQLRDSPRSGFYLYATRRPAPARLGVVPAALKFLGRISPFRTTTVWRRALIRMAARVDRRPGIRNLLGRVDFLLRAGFGCRDCGNCVLGDLEYICPETCPKRIRNGPCGGAADGMCEVDHEMPCVWGRVYERARANGELELLHVYVPPPDRALAGTSAWMNALLDRSVRPGFPPSSEVDGAAGPRLGGTGRLDGGEIH